VLHRFNGSRDGAFPLSAVIEDSQGNLFGSTRGDGAFGCGTIFELSPKAKNWDYKVLYNLRNGTTAGALTFDQSGNLYGMVSPIDVGACQVKGVGEVFKLSLAPPGAWKYSVAYRFGQNGAQPSSGLVHDKRGNFYGTTATGGSGGYGVVFEWTP